MVCKIVPTSFLHYYSLKTGALFAAILKIIFAIVQFILTIIGVFGIQDSTKSSSLPWREAYAHFIVVLFYSIIMILVSVWFIWGILHKKASVVLCWVVVASIWLAQNMVFLIVLILVYYLDVSLSVFITFQIVVFITIVIFIYSILIGYGHYKELKNTNSDRTGN